MSYFISPPDQTEWRITTGVLAKELLMQWPNSRIEFINNLHNLHVLAWSFQLGGLLLDGTLTKDGNVVNLNGDIRACATFALWFRKQVPTHQDLLFYDDDYSADVSLLMETTKDELVIPFLVQKSDSSIGDFPK